MSHSIDSTSAYCKAFRDRLTSTAVADAERPAVDGLCGRVLRGVRARDFERLSAEDPSWKRVVFVIGPDGLGGLLRTSSDWDAGLLLGFDPEWMRSKVAEGVRFKLCVFPQRTDAAHPLGVLATWDGVFSTVESLYPEVAQYVRVHEAEVRRRSVDELDIDGEMRRVARMSYAERRAHEGFITPQRLLSGPLPPSLARVRAFLYHTLGLNVNFSGDGFSSDADGRHRCREYLCPNSSVADLRAEMIDMDIREPTPAIIPPDLPNAKALSAYPFDTVYGGSLIFAVDDNGEEVLKTQTGAQVMMAWEKPLMQQCVAALSLESHDDVLEIGYGLGYSAHAIQERNPRSHTIIECDPAVLKRARAFAAGRPGVTVVEGVWQGVISSIGCYSAVFFDDFPLAGAGDVAAGGAGASSAPSGGAATSSRWHDFIDACLRTGTIAVGSRITGYLAHRIDLERPGLDVTMEDCPVDVSPLCGYFAGTTAVIPVVRVREDPRLVASVVQRLDGAAPTSRAVSDADMAATSLHADSDSDSAEAVPKETTRERAERLAALRARRDSARAAASSAGAESSHK